MAFISLTISNKMVIAASLTYFQPISIGRWTPSFCLNRSGLPEVSSLCLNQEILFYFIIMDKKVSKIAGLNSQNPIVYKF